MATDLSNYNQTVVTAPTAPSKTSKFDLDEFHVLIRERVKDDVVMEPKMQAELILFLALASPSLPLSLSTGLGSMRVPLLLFYHL